MAFIGAPSRFNEFRDDFFRDTGINDIKENMDVYSQYVTARFADLNHRLLSNLSNEIQELQKVLRKV
jgi:hypothetical protein